MSHETVEQLAETANSDCPDESWMSIEGPSPHIEVMQYEPTVENVIDALPGEVDCWLASVPSLLQPRIASGTKIHRIEFLIVSERSLRPYLDGASA